MWARIFQLQTVFLLAGLVVLTSCATDPEADHTLKDLQSETPLTRIKTSEAPRPAAADPRAEAEAVRTIYRIKFIDTSEFDDQLGNRLEEKYKSVFVRPVAPFTVNEIPPRIDKWLYAVKQRGGKVELEELPPETLLAKRSLVSFLVDFLIRAFDLMRERVKYDSAQYYNVKIAYRSDTGRVERLTFLQRM